MIFLFYQKHPFIMSDCLRGKNPRLCVCDCDYTLYNYDCDKDRRPPFYTAYNPTFQEDFYLSDAYGRNANIYPQVAEIMAAFVDANIDLAFASRNPSAKCLKELLSAIEISPKKQHIRILWDAMSSERNFQAYSSTKQEPSKTRHFRLIQEATQIPYKDMLFFDDAPDNIECAETLGVTAVLVKKGVGITWEMVESGITRWRERNVSAEEPVSEKESLSDK
jgi:magnesium-dependent phosphatase-1